MSWKETDAVALWKNATVVPLVASNVEAEKDEAMRDKTPIAQRLHGKRSALWTSLLEMSADQRQSYLHRLVRNWPYTTERRALNWPMHFLAGAASLSAGFIAAKINADMFLLNPKIRLQDAIRKSPYLPFGLAIYTTGICTYAMHRYFVFKPLVEDEDHPNPLTLFATTAAVQLFTGVFLPALTTPHLSYFIKLYQEPHQYRSKNYIDSITLSYEFSRAVWRRLPVLVAIQLVVVGLSAYSVYWARKRIYTTVDVDPDYIREVMHSADQNRNKLADTLYDRYDKLKKSADAAFPAAPTRIH